MKEERKTVSYPYPEEVYDEHGYPTREALDYIKNWSYEFEEKQVVWGQHALTEDYTSLIDYLKSIWSHSNAIVHKDGLLAIHTMGVYGNEEIISVLQTTTLWMYKMVASQTGGHYYFRLDSNSKHTWRVQMVESE